MTAATSEHETPVYFEVDGEDLFGIVTEPVAAGNGMAVLLAPGGLWLPSPGRNRFWTTMARRFAGDGFRTMRFDYHGVGESSGQVQEYRLDNPAARDVAGAARVLADGIQGGTVLIGTCYGARSLLAAAGDVADVCAVALYAPPVRDFVAGHQFTSKPLRWWARKAFTWRAVRGLADAKRRETYAKLAARKVRAVRDRVLRRGAAPAPKIEKVSPIFLAQLDALVERRVPVLLVYGRDDACYDDFHRARETRLGRIVERAGDQMTIVEVEGKVHGLTSSAVQRSVADSTAEWLADLLVHLAP